MLRLILPLVLLAPTTSTAEQPARSVPNPRVLTPDGDRRGYALVPRARPYTGVLLGYDPVAREEVLCGGSVLRSRSRSLVLTAAHCLYHQGRALKRVTFLPAFDEGGAPEGAWRAVRTWVPTRWQEEQDATARLPYDVALVGVAAKRRTLEKATGGGLRPLTERTRERSRILELLGYPMGSAYPGTRQYRCLGAAAPYRGVLITHNCHASGGGSGGPALYGGAVAGVVSSSSPLADRDGFTVLARLDSEPFRRILTQADRAMLVRRRA